VTVLAPYLIAAAITGTVMLILAWRMLR